MKKQNLDKKKILNKLIILFLYLIPVSGLSIFHNHITNLIIVLLIGIMLLMTLIIYKESRNGFKYLFLYYILCVVFLAISYFRSKSFYSLIPNDYSLLSEALTIIKLVMPITILFILKYQKISKHEYFNIIKCWIIFIAGSIIVSNLLKISYSSYGFQHITKNIFEWRKDVYYVYTASKGFFTYANQVSAILLPLLVIVTYKYLQKENNYIIYIFLIVFAMLMLGTRVSTLGGLLTIICLLIGYILISLFRKEKINKKSFILLIPIAIWIILLPISPYANRNIELSAPNNIVEDNKENIEINKENKKDETKKEETDKEKPKSEYSSKKIEYVYTYYDPNKMPSIFFEKYYPIEYDENFWYEIVKNQEKTGINYRYLENKIIQRVIEKDNKWSNVLFGISNSRIQNIINVEQDIVLHYYAYGILGTILFLLIYLITLFKGTKIFFEKRDYNSFCSLALIGLFIFSSILTGNILNSLFSILTFAFASNFMQKNV